MTELSIKRRIEYAKELLETVRLQIDEIYQYAIGTLSEADQIEWLEYATEKLNLAVKGIGRLNEYMMPFLHKEGK